MTAATRVNRAGRAARKPFKPLALAAAIACSGAMAPALAVPMHWFGGNGDWDVDANWSPFGSPGAGDTAFISAGTANLTNSTLVGGLNLSGGAITGIGNLGVSGAASWTGGSICGYGGSLVNNNTLAISGSSGKALGNYCGDGSSDGSSGGVVNNATATWSGSGNLSNYASGRFTNSAGASFDIQTDADFSGGTLVNQGTLSKSFGATDGGNMTVISGDLQNTGSINVQQGTLQVSSAFDNQGSLNVAAGAIFNGNNAVFTNSGTLEGNGTPQTALHQAPLNNGVISPGNSVGHLTVQGDLIDDAATALHAQAVQWIMQVARTHVAEPFRESFLHRNAVNRALLAGQPIAAA